MTQTVRVPHAAWLLVGDGRKALVFRNEGTADRPRFAVQHVLKGPENPRTSAQGTERPTRVFESVGPGRSAAEATDWHELEEARFARDVAAALDLAFQAGWFARLVVVAPPKTLAELRSAFSADLRRAVIGEIDKTYTNHPVGEIERLMAA